MTRLIECVPNFSEGRDLAKIEAIAQAMGEVPRAWILDRTSDPDHNRSVITLAGEPEAVAEAAIRGAGRAAELIDMTRQAGVHPRIGATDVMPFVPLQGVSMADCVTLARYAGRELWNRYRIPVYFYEAAATRPDRVNLENIRRGQFEALREDTLRNPDRAPDIGGPGLHPTAGATVVGARKFLIAYNIYLNTNDVSVAKAIARAIRSSSGGLPSVKAIGVEIKSRGLAQVSMNLTDFEETPLSRAFDAVEREAGQRGFAVVGSEIIGLVPRKAIEVSLGHDLKLENFSADRILENRLAAVAELRPAPPGPALEPGPEAALQPLIETLREAVQQFSEQSLDGTDLTGPGGSISARLKPQAMAESHLQAAAASAEIYHRLVQLEAMAGASMMLDWAGVKQAAKSAARSALAGAEALLPSLRDAGTAARIKTRMAEIEAKLSGRPVTTET